jgi:hypothetical protein
MRIRIRDPEFFDPGSGIEKFRIWDKHPVSATLGARKLAKIAVMFTFSPAVLSNPNRHPVRILQPKICCVKLGRFYRYILPPPPRPYSSYLFSYFRSVVDKYLRLKEEIVELSHDLSR